MGDNSTDVVIVAIEFAFQITFQQLSMLTFNVQVSLYEKVEYFVLVVSVTTQVPASTAEIDCILTLTVVPVLDILNQDFEDPVKIVIELTDPNRKPQLEGL